MERWKQVLEKLEANNMKLAPKNTLCFPIRMELLGWIKEGEFLHPDPHRTNTLLSASPPQSIKELRSYLGTLHTLHKCMKKQNVILAPLT